MKSNETGRPRFLDVSHVFLVICLLFFCLFLVSTLRMEEVSSYLLPRLLCVFGIIVVSIRLVFDYLRPPEDLGDETPEEASETRGLHVGYSITFVAAYFFLTPLLGFMLATGIAMGAFCYLMKFPQKKLAVILSVIVPLILHLAFVTLLNASLPAGILEDLLF